MAADRFDIRGDALRHSGVAAPDPDFLQIVPDAWHAMLSYLSFHIVETPGGYNALQQLSYAAVIFLLAPFSIATGVAMSPAVAARFPWYIKIFHGRQSARSLHFLALAPSSYSSSDTSRSWLCMVSGASWH